MAKVYKDAKGRWVSDTRTKLSSGKTIGSRKVFKTKSDANLDFADRIQNQEIKVKRVKEDPTLDELYEKYIKTISNINTKRDKQSIWNNYLAPFYRKRKITVSMIDRQLMKSIGEYISTLEYTDEQLEYKKRHIKSSEHIDDKEARKLSKNLKNNIDKENRVFIRWLQYKEYLDEDIDYFRNVKRNKKVKTPDQPVWSPNEFKQFIEVVDDNVLKAFYYVLALCGLRKSEARGLKYKNISFEDDTIHVDEQLKQGIGQTRILKTEASRRIVNMPEVVKKHLEKIRDDQLATGISEEELLDEYVFKNSRGEPFPQETIRRKTEEYIKKSGVKHVTIHSLRHFYATVSARAGSLRYAQKQLGHTNEDMTVARYLAASEDDKKDYINGVNQLFEYEEQENK